MVARFPLSKVRRAIAENRLGSPRVAVFYDWTTGPYLYYCVKPVQPGARCSGTVHGSSVLRRLEA